MEYDGKGMIADGLKDVTRVFLNNESMNIELNEGQQPSMKWHRENLFKKYN